MSCMRRELSCAWREKFSSLRRLISLGSIVGFNQEVALLQSIGSDRSGGAWCNAMRDSPDVISCITYTNAANGQSATSSRARRMASPRVVKSMPAPYRRLPERLVDEFAKFVRLAPRDPR